ncbi:hypothetical protein EPH_0010500 [Eimeria praecox]|uniref:Uncharacterized protein n=1 Tax=Eimeria praecox TaxID=51316 RepID=U6GUI6_9EIME|nr:hypothetical protein EPH_0010500 [Eimeria praecox]
MPPGRLPAPGNAPATDTPVVAKAFAPADTAAAEAATGKPSEATAAASAASTEDGDFVKLDKNSFCKHEEVTCLRVPLQQLQELSKALRKHLFKRRNVRPVIPDTAKNSQKEESSQQKSQHEQPQVGEHEAQQQEKTEKLAKNSQKEESSQQKSQHEQPQVGEQEAQQQEKTEKQEEQQEDNGKCFKCLLLDPSIGPGKQQSAAVEKIEET